MTAPLLAVPSNRDLAAAFVGQHLEALRDYFLPGDSYRTSGEEFTDQALAFILRHGVLAPEVEARGSVGRSMAWVSPTARWRLQRIEERRRLRVECMTCARGWNAGRVPSTLRRPRRGHVNLRREDRAAWAAWYERLRHAQMHRRLTPRTEVLEATDPVDGHVVTFAAPDMEPPLEEGTGNQLSATTEHVLQRHAVNPTSGTAYNEQLGAIRCRSVTDVHTFETRWNWDYNDPTGDEAMMEVAKPRVCRCLAAALRLPRRTHNRTIRWTTLDLLLDTLSPCFAPDYAAQLVDAVFERDPSYKAHIDRLVAASQHRGRPQAALSNASDTMRSALSPQAVPPGPTRSRVIAHRRTRRPRSRPPVSVSQPRLPLPAQ